MEEPDPQRSVSSPAEQGTPWAAILIGALVLAALAGGLVLLTGRPSTTQTAPAGPHAYASKLQFDEMKMTVVENFVGGKVTHLEGRLTNTGDRTVSGVSVEVVFRNALGEMAQKDTLAVRVQQQVGGYTDVVDLKAAPLKPGESRGFRLTFDHVSTDWNRAYPEITVTAVTFQ
jgi:hypothetical protein